MEVDRSAAVDADEFTAELQELYEEIKLSLNKVIGKEQFGPQHIEMIISLTTKTIQKFVVAGNSEMSGAEKKAVALRVVKHVITDFRKSGQIPEDVYNQLMVAIDVLGSVMVDLVVASWKKIVKTTIDVADNGCSGCCKRNCTVQ
jgi:hypothetical protein